MEMFINWYVGLQILVSEGWEGGGKVSSVPWKEDSGRA